MTWHGEKGPAGERAKELADATYSEARGRRLLAFWGRLRHGGNQCPGSGGAVRELGYGCPRAARRDGTGLCHVCGEGILAPGRPGHADALTVSVAMFSPLGPDLTNATAAEVITAIMKEFGGRPFMLDDFKTDAPHYVRPLEVNRWLVAHGCRRFRFTHYVHDQFELVAAG